MGLFLKKVTQLNRSMYLYYPEFERHNPYIVRLLTVLRPDASEASVQKLLDDGLKKLAEEKSYVKYYKNPQCLGAAANWNAAISKARGEYIKIMHHDDWFTDENSLREFVNMLEEHPEACLGFSGSRQEEKEKSFRKRKETLLQVPLFRLTVVCCRASFFFRKLSRAKAFGV